MKWDFEWEDSLDWNSHIAWATFTSVEELRPDLLNKIRQMIYEFASINSMANPYSEISRSILELTDDQHMTMIIQSTKYLRCQLQVRARKK
jgi:hypothetical protein